MNIVNNYKFKVFLKKHTINKVFFNKTKLKQNLNSKILVALIKPLVTVPYKLNKNKYFNTQKTLALNFKRNRFFPTLRTLKGESYIFLSLGMFIKFFNKSKSFLKSKSMYLILASFFRKILMFGSFKNLILTINKTPVFLKEIMSTINDSVVAVYKNPFNDIEVNEKTYINKFKFSFIMFLNNKPFGPLKLKKKGRLKRKISKKIILMNRITD